VTGRSSRGRVVLGRLAFGAVLLLSLVVLFAPGSDVPPAPHGVDKLVHAGLFAGLAVTGRWAGLPVRPLLAALAAYAAASEVVQAVAPLGRDGSVWDWLADLAGILLGLLLWDRISRRRRR
jgi:VanZ family protein